MPAIIIQDVCVSNLHSKSGKIFVQFNVDDRVKHKTRKSTAAPDSTAWPEQVSFDEPETAILSATVYGRRWYFNYPELRHTEDISLGDLLTRTPQPVVLSLLTKESQEAGTLSFSIASVPTTPTTPIISTTEAQAANVIIQASEATAREVQLGPSYVGSRSTLESSEVDSLDQQHQTASTSRTTPVPCQEPGSGSGVVTKHNEHPDLRICTSHGSAEQFLDKGSTSLLRHLENAPAQRDSNPREQPAPVLVVETPKTPDIWRRIICSLVCH